MVVWLVLNELERRQLFRQIPEKSCGGNSGEGGVMLNNGPCTLHLQHEYQPPSSRAWLVSRRIDSACDCPWNGFFQRQGTVYKNLCRNMYISILLRLFYPFLIFSPSSTTFSLGPAFARSRNAVSNYLGSEVLAGKTVALMWDGARRNEPIPLKPAGHCAHATSGRRERRLENHTRVKIEIYA
jgi:hypothetical protein